MNILVTGGSGFIGSALVLELIKKGFNVRTLNRKRCNKHLNLGVECIYGDIRNIKVINQAVKGIDVIFHVAAKIGYWGKGQEYYDINVIGTQNLLYASKSHGVQKFIYTSTPSVVGYFKDVIDGDQYIPYPTSYLSSYSKTKAIAEQNVLNFNQEKIATIALRPHLVFGPGDNNLLPQLIHKAVSGKLPIIGNKKILVDFTYVDNVVSAHLCALESLVNSTSKCAGKPYFISNNEPVELWSWINKILVELGHPKIQKNISRPLAYSYSVILETVWKLFALKSNPPLTRFMVNAMTRHHYYSMKPANDDLKYSPIIFMDKATDRTIQWLKKRTNFSF